jgi:hypothetical protein
MSSLMIGNFGEQNRIHTYRVCGEKKDLEQIVKECTDLGFDFDINPDIEFVHRGQYTVLLKLKVPVTNTL